MIPDTLDSRPRPAPTTGADPYQDIRSTVIEMDADAVARQLPRLAETIATESVERDGVLSFVIGVSLSTNDTLLDYRLEALVEDGSDGPHLETLKPAISRDHLYLTFSYPPDPHFDAGALRGALLEVIERCLHQADFTRGPSEPEETPPFSSRVSDLLTGLVKC